MLVNQKKFKGLVFNISLFIFVFRLVNREFRLGFDIRYLGFIFSLFSIYISRDKIKNLKNNEIEQMAISI